MYPPAPAWAMGQAAGKAAEQGKGGSDSAEGHVSRRRANGESGDGLGSTASESIFPVTERPY